jgi:hypothetical protein
VRAAGTFSPGDLGVLVIGRGRSGRERWGAGPREVGACASLTESHGGNRGTSAWGERGSARSQALYGRGGARRGGTGMCRGGVRECCNGAASRRHSARRALEEEKAGLLHLEVSSRFSRHSGFEGLELKLLSPC